MAIGKIRKIEGPYNKNFHDGSYEVFIEGISTRQLMFKAQLDLLKFENEMLEKGIPEDIIEKHRDLVIEHVQDEISLDGESE